MNETTNNVVEITDEKLYTLRKLEAKDIFLMSKIIGEIGLGEFSSSLRSNTVKGSETEEGALESVGMVMVINAVNVIMQHLPACEKDIYAFLSNVSNLEKKQIESLPINTFAEMILEIFEKEEFADFMKVVSRLLK